MELIFRVLLFAVALGGYSTLLVGIVNRTHAYGWNRKFVDMLTVLCATLLVVGLWPLAQFAAGGQYPSTWPHLSAALVQGFGWASSVLATIAFIHSTWCWFHPERRGGVGAVRTSPIEMPQPAEQLLAEGVPRFLGTLPGNEVVRPQLVETQLLVPRLPVAFEGLKIAHLTDLHMSGRIRQEYFDHIVKVSNEHFPDVVAITGDIVEVDDCLDWIDESLAKLQATEAKLFVLGNHDVKSDPAEIRRRLTDAGFVHVGGRAMDIELSQGPCVVVGNEMPWFPPTPNIPSRAPHAAADKLRLALVHTPDHFHWAERNGIHVVLAGHVHGGQVRFPVLGALLSPSIYGTRYASGGFRTGDTVMHVSPGTASLATIRWNCPPELNLLTLRGC